MDLKRCPFKPNPNAVQFCDGLHCALWLPMRGPNGEYVEEQGLCSHAVSAQALSQVTVLLSMLLDRQRPQPQGAGLYIPKPN